MFKINKSCSSLGSKLNIIATAIKYSTAFTKFNLFIIMSFTSSTFSVCVCIMHGSSYIIYCNIMHTRCMLKFPIKFVHSY